MFYALMLSKCKLNVTQMVLNCKIFVSLGIAKQRIR
jgi:hypothetical protein